jgi:hypothetical protein
VVRAMWFSRSLSAQNGSYHDQNLLVSAITAGAFSGGIEFLDLRKSMAVLCTVLRYSRRGPGYRWHPSCLGLYASAWTHRLL